MDYFDDEKTQIKMNDNHNNNNNNYNNNKNNYSREQM